MAPSLSVALPQYTQDLVNCQVGEMMRTLFQAGREPELSVAWKSNILLTHVSYLHSGNLTDIKYLTLNYAKLSGVQYLTLQLGKLRDVLTIC